MGLKRLKDPLFTHVLQRRFKKNHLDAKNGEGDGRFWKEQREELRRCPVEAQKAAMLQEMQPFVCLWTAVFFFKAIPPTCFGGKFFFFSDKAASGFKPCKGIPVEFLVEAMIFGSWVNRGFSMVFLWFLYPKRFCRHLFPQQNREVVSATRADWWKP